MPAECTVCTHPDQEALDSGLMAGVPKTELARRHEVSRFALNRHESNGHVAPELKALQAAPAIPDDATARERLLGLIPRAERLLTAAEESGKASVALSSVAELRRLVEALAKLTGELDESPRIQVLNVSANPEWVAIRGALLEALAPYPDARAQVVTRLRALNAGEETA